MNSLGASRLTNLVFLALFGASAFCAYKIIPFYYYYFELQNQMSQLLKLADSTSDLEIRKKLETHIKELEIPVNPSQLQISRDGRKIRASLKYSEIFFISFRGKDYDLREFPFHAYAEEEY
jgi:carbonic anhydrase